MQEQGNMQALQQSLAPQGAAAPAPQDPAMTQPASPEVPTTGIIETNLNNLPEEHKAFVSEHLTPEMAVVVGLITGDMSISDQLRPFVNPERVLVPVNRQEFESMAQQKAAEASPTDPTQAASAAPTPAPQPGAGSQPQQQTATPASAGPVK